MIELFFLLILSSFVGFPFALYWIPKKLGYPRASKILSYSVGSILILLVFNDLFRDQLFSKNDAEELLAEQNIIVENDFEVLENRSMWGIGDYYHSFTLKIAEGDKQKIIRFIKNSPNYTRQNKVTWLDDNQFDIPNRYIGKKTIKNYETKSCFIRELFEPQGMDYSPKFRRIEISKQGNTLRFEDLEE